VDASNTASAAIKMIKDGCILEITDSLSVQNSTPNAKFIQTTLTNLPKPIQVQSKDRRACRCGGDSYVLKKIVKNPGQNNGRGYYACNKCNFFEWHINES